MLIFLNTISLQTISLQPIQKILVNKTYKNIVLNIYEYVKKCIPFLQCERGIFLCKKILDFVFI